MVRPAATVAIVVDDPSRWTPVREALPIVLRRLHAAGFDREDVTISVGVGRHHAVDAEAMRRRLGDSIAAGYRCFSPPVDDLSAYVDLGPTPHGVPVRIFRPVAEADLRILIGSVLPHLQAGFGGGYKLILPGTSHRTTLGALHRQGLDGQSDPAGLLGERCGRQPDAASDPCRSRAARTVLVDQPPCSAVMGQVFRIVAGHPERVQDLLAAEARRRLQAPTGTRRQTWSWRATTPGRATRCKASKCCFTTARPAGPAVCWSACSGPTPLRSIARSPSPPCGASRRQAPGEDGRSGGCCRRLRRIVGASGSPAAFMLHWACELVVDRTVLVLRPTASRTDRAAPGSRPAFRRSIRALARRRRGRSIGQAQLARSVFAFASFPRGSDVRRRFVSRCSVNFARRSLRRAPSGSSPGRAIARMPAFRRPDRGAGFPW